MPQYLVVEGGGTLYALEQALVREIVPARAITRIPGAPPAVRGLLNVRGTLITVVDLAHRFSRREATAAQEPSVVIAVTSARTLGLLVDDVHEVMAIAADALVRPDADITDVAIAGAGHFGERIVLVVDVQELARQTLA